MLRCLPLCVVIAACSQTSPPAGPSSLAVTDAQAAPAKATAAVSPSTPAESNRPGSATDCPKCPECACTSAELADLKAKLEAAEAKIAVLSATPEAVYADLRSRLDADSFTMEALDANLEAIADFRTRFPRSPEAKLLVAEVREIEEMKKRLEAQVRQENEAKAAEEMVRLVGEVEDGTDFALSSVERVATAIIKHGLDFDSLMRLPLAKYEEAMKDPSTDRGRTIVVTGRVIQIIKDGEYFRGQICQGTFCDKVVFFVTPGTTRGIVEGKRATFAGTLIQRFTYETLSGGVAHSLLLVGQFKGQ